MDFLSVLFFMANLMFYRSVCFYYSTILNPPLCSGRGDVDLCFYTSEEIMNYRKGEERESVRSLSPLLSQTSGCVLRGA